MEPVISLKRSPPLAVLPAEPVISRKKSLQLAALPAELAISNPFYPHEACSRQEAACREHTKCYSVYPICIEKQKARAWKMKQYFSFQWHITDECDQRCKHCYIFSENNCKKLDAMTWEQMKETFYNCRFLPGV